MSQAKVDRYKEEKKNRKQTIRQYGNIDRLTRDILIEFIDTIYVYEGGRISIKFRFADEFRKIQEYIDLNIAKTTD